LGCDYAIKVALGAIEPKPCELKLGAFNCHR
jgi:hypothetical protein